MFIDEINIVTVISIFVAEFGVPRLAVFAGLKSLFPSWFRGGRKSSLYAIDGVLHARCLRLAYLG